MPPDHPDYQYTRRHLLKALVFGGAAAHLAACREPGVASAHLDATTAGTTTATTAADAGLAALRKLPTGESFERCHMVRDGAAIESGPITGSADVVIVGGGPSGLSAAYRLRDRDVVVLEKEQVLGGNCTLYEWEGVRMASGGAFYTESETKLVALLDEIGARGAKIEGTDSLIIEGEPVTDFFREGVSKLRLPTRVKDDLRRSYEEVVKIYEKRPKKALDAVPFSTLLEPYAPEVREFWDRFGRSNWGSDAANTSGYIGAQAYTWAGGMQDPRWTHPGGLAGAAQILGEVVKRSLGERLITGAAVYRVEREGKGAAERAIVRYHKDGQVHAIRARAVILAIPKLFAKMIVPGLPDSQLADMRATRYEPFVVLNVCLSSPGPDPAYDNWFLDTPFTDFIVADWIVHAGKGPPDRKTALSVYWPLREEERALLLVDPVLLDMADRAVDHLERHFPGLRSKIAEVHLFRRGHAMFASTPGRLSWVDRVSRPFGPIFFAHTDSAEFASFDGGLEAADKAVAGALKKLGKRRG